jgi:hypothetical protein
MSVQSVIAPTPEILTTVPVQMTSQTRPEDCRASRSRRRGEQVDRQAKATDRKRTWLYVEDRR